MQRLIASIVVSSTLLTACGGASTDETTQDVSNNTERYSSVSLTTPFAVLDDCPNGGIEIQTGIDSNGNGTLDASEVDNTQSVCHGTDGSPGLAGTSSLISTSDELAGDNCVNGGTRIDIGMDSDNSGALEASEITATQYVCNGDEANGTDGSDGLTSLIDMTDEPEGDNCPNGGLLISTGLDLDESNSLEASEVTDSRYICNGEGGAVVEGSDFYQCDDETTCRIYGTVDRDFTLTADKTWFLTEDVYVGSGNGFILSESHAETVKANGVILTIEPGTEIQALPDTTLVVTRGSKLMAEGTADEPISFTGYDASNTWDGIRLQGLAEYYPDDNDSENSCIDLSSYCNYTTPGYGYSGGHLNEDNSGVIKYVTISGAKLGLILATTGHGTTIDHIQLQSTQIGLVMIGGSTNISYLSTKSAYEPYRYDYSSTYITYGHKGNLQHAIIDMPIDGFYYYGLDIRGAATDVSASNITFISYSDALAAYTDYLGTLTLYNSLVHGNGFADCFYSRDYDGSAWYLEDYQNIINATDNTCYDALQEPLSNTDITIDSSGALITEETVSVTNWQPVDNGSGFVFDNTNYVGAVEPGTAVEDAWWYGWTIEGSMDDIATPEE